MTQFKETSKGTQMPLINLKGKPYLQVAYRLVWFREDHPNGKIVTTPISITEDFALFKATISVLDGSKYRKLATAHKKETKQGFGDFIEKAETGSVGRALAMCGYGTQFEPEFDEEDRVVDSPIETPIKKSILTQKSARGEGSFKQTPITPRSPTSEAPAVKIKPKDKVQDAVSPQSQILTEATKFGWTKANLVNYSTTAYGKDRASALTDQEANEFLEIIRSKSYDNAFQSLGSGLAVEEDLPL